MTCDEKDETVCSNVLNKNISAVVMSAPASELNYKIRCLR